MSISDDRPWFEFWPEGVPCHIDYPEIPLFEFLSNMARKHPDKTAFSCRGHKLSYGELDVLTSKLATCLSELGIKRGDGVVLFLPNSLEFVIGYYGILKAGGTVIPANPLYKAEDLKHQLTDSGTTAIITGGNSYAVVEEIKDETRLKIVISTDSEGIEEAVSLEKILARYPPNPPALDLDPKEQIAAIEYTGGGNRTSQGSNANPLQPGGKCHTKRHMVRVE